MFAQVDNGIYKWAIEQGVMAIVLVAVGVFMWNFGSKLVNKWITTLDKTDTHLEASTKAMQDVSTSLGSLNDGMTQIKPLIEDIHRHTQPKEHRTG